MLIFIAGMIVGGAIVMVFMCMLFAPKKSDSEHELSILYMAITRICTAEQIGKITSIVLEAREGANGDETENLH